MSLCQVAASHEPQPFALVFGPREPLHGDAQGPAPMLALDGMRDEIARTGHAGHRTQAVLEIRRQPRHLGEWSARVALYHPQISTDLIDDYQRVLDHPA